MFERLPLDDFGNRIPQFPFEVLRPVGALEGMIRGVTLIPGATEFGSTRRRCAQSARAGETATANRHI